MLNKRSNKPSHISAAAVLAAVVAMIILSADGFAAENPAKVEQRGAQSTTSAFKSGPTLSKPEIISLNQCIEIALAKNPAVLAATYGVEISRSKVGESRSAYYPQISASGAYNRIKPMPGSISSLNGTNEFDQYSSNITLNQNIIDFGKTSSSVDISKYNRDASQFDLTTTQDLVVLNVKQSYYGVLQAQHNRDVAADVLKQFQLHLDQAKGFYEVGTKAKIDVIKAEVDLSNAKLGLIKAENSLKIARVTLNNVMGVPDASDYSIEDNLSFQPNEISIEHAITRAYENRPDLRSLVARRQAAETNISLARTGYYPALTGNANYNWTDDTTSTINRTWGWSAGIVLTVPLFSGFLTSHQVAEAKSALYQIKANEELLRQQIVLDIQQAYLNLQQSQDSITTAELAVTQAKENMDLANGRYAAGVGSPIEVSDAFATYVSVQASYTGALYNYRIAQANIEKAMGAR